MIQMIGITERGDPAFDRGWVDWVKDGKPAVLVSKNFKKIYDEVGTKSNVMYHATITGYGGTPYEPGVPDKETILDSLNEVPKSYRDHVVVRIDPIIPKVNIFQVVPIYEWAIENDFEVRISYLDYYNHTKSRLVATELSARESLNKNMHRHSELIEIYKKSEMTDDLYDEYVKVKNNLRFCARHYHTDKHLDELYNSSLHAPLEYRKEITEKYFPKAVVCGEPGFDNVGCISEKTCNILGIEYAGGKSSQRDACSCCGQKFELLSSKKRCPHGCWYCYWKD